MTDNKTEILQEVMSNLIQLQGIIELAAFAAETRRVLTEVDYLTEIHPEFDKKMNGIYGWRTFTDIPDSLSEVLLEASKGIQKSHELIDRASWKVAKHD